MEARCLSPTQLSYVVQRTKGKNTEVPINNPLPRHNGHRSDKSQKAFARVSHSSKGSGATVEYLYPGIQAKGLMSVTSAHPMVKDATTTSSDSEDEVFTSSDPQGPSHASSNSKYDVSASFDPQGVGHALSNFEDEVSVSSNPQGLGHASSNFEYEVSTLSDP